MNPVRLPFWHQAQIALLRLLSIALRVIDRLFKVRWGEHLLERIANHWQTQLQQLDESLARLEKEREKIQFLTEALTIHAAAIYLGGRSQNRGELRFDPGISHDEELLDATIELLVKQRLAAVETEEIEPGRFVYHLEPDWSAIHRHLSQAADLAEPEIAEWFREGLTFIDEAILTGAVSQADHPT